MAKDRIFLSTQNEYSGCKRKLAWFTRHENDLYFDFGELGGIFMGSHTSYHIDGNIFRTSPASMPKATFMGNNMPLNDFNSWYQFGTVMFMKESVVNNPCLKSKNIRQAVKIEEVNLNKYPSSTINMVVEILSSEMIDLLTLKHLSAPPDADTYVIDEIHPIIVITIFGHEHNLLIKPISTGFKVSHYNSRFSTNRKGSTYTYEAIG